LTLSVFYERFSIGSQPFKYNRVPPCYLIDNYATNLDVSGENWLRTWYKLFFPSAIYNRKCAYQSFNNSTPPQLTSVQWSLFRLWQLKNEEIEAFC